MTDLPKISDEEMDELVKLFRAGHAAAPVPSTPDERVRAGLAVALVASGYRREADVLREAYWKLHDHAEAYRSGELSRKVQERFRADPDNPVLARAASRDKWYAGGIDAAARDIAELMGVPEHEIDRATALEPSLPLPVADGSKPAAHERLVCRHGWVVAQCKCIGPHVDRVVDYCPSICGGLPPANPITEESSRG